MTKLKFNKNTKTIAMTWLLLVFIIASTGFNVYLFNELGNKNEEISKIQTDLKNTKEDVMKLNTAKDGVEIELSHEKENNAKKIKEINDTFKKKEAEKDSIIKQKDSEISDLQAKKEEKKKLALLESKEEEAKPEQKEIAETKNALIVKNTSVKTEEAVSPKSVNIETSGRQMTVEATMFGAVDGSQSGITATGIDVRGTSTYNGMKIVAVDPNVIPLWSIIEIEGYGTAIALDTGGMIKGNKMDILTSSNEEAMNFGRKPINITIVREGK